MALDPALAVVLGALVGGGFTFAGSVIGNTQQARRERKVQKLEAYRNSMRYLVRLKTLYQHEPLAPEITDDREWIEDYVEVQYWLTMTSALCAGHLQERIQKVALSFGRVDVIPSETKLAEALKKVTDAARDDIGAPPPALLQRVFRRDTAKLTST